MREKILVVFIAVAIGLVITTLVYLLYQQTKTIPTKAPGASSMNSMKAPSPTEKPGYITLSSPTDNSVVTKRTVTVAGKTQPQDTLVISTNQEDVVAKPASNGKFTSNVTIDAGANIIIVRSIAPDGTSHTVKRIVTFSTEEF